jgi:hypothetical protein
MKALLLSLITAGALLASTSTADARPPRYSGVWVYPSVNTSPYYSHNWGYYPNYVYPASGVSVNFGNFGLNVGSGYNYPSYYGYNRGYYSNPYYYSRPYYGGYYYGNRWWRGW